MQNGKVTIGLIQMSVEKDREAMLKKALVRVEEAARAGADIICLPELYRTQYFPRHIGIDASGSAETIPGESTVAFSRIAKEHEVVIIVPLYEKAPDGNYYNSAVVIDTDGTTGIPYHKVHIPQDPGFFEKGYFYPGNAYRVVSTQFGRIAVHPGAVLREDLHAELFQGRLHAQVAAPVEIPVRTADGAAFHGRHLRQRAHAHAAYAGEMYGLFHMDIIH